MRPHARTSLGQKFLPIIIHSTGKLRPKNGRIQFWPQNWFRSLDVIFWRNYLDSPSASTCCTVLDLILDYIFEKLYPSSNSLKTTKEPEGNAWQLALEKNPDILLNVLWNYVNLKKFYLQLLSTLLNQILFEGNV